MKRLLLAALLLGSSDITSAQQVPDIGGGTWLATTEVPATLPAAPSAILGGKFAINQNGRSLTVLRPVRDMVTSSTIEIGGPEAKTTITGPTCLGDSLLFETATLEGDAVVLTITGSQAVGGPGPNRFNTRRLLRRLSADTLLVEASITQGGQARQVGTIYKRSADVLTATVRPTAPIAATIGAVQWIGGTWSSAGVGTPPPATTTEERWTPSAGSTMMGMARGVRNSTMVSFEFLCIVERGGGLVYSAMPSGRAPATDFMLTSVTGTSATFENPAHDFPKKIRYSLTPEGLLLTEVSGAAGSRVIAVTLKKQ